MLKLSLILCSWYSRFPVGQAVRHQVLGQHGRSLKEFCVTSIWGQISFDESIRDPQLEIFECRSIEGPSFALDSIVGFIARNSSTLHTLKLGQERVMLLRYHERYTPHQNEDLL